MSLWSSGRVPVSHAGDSGFESSYLFKIILFFLSLNSPNRNSLNAPNSVKVFRENSSDVFTIIMHNCISTVFEQQNNKLA